MRSHGQQDIGQVRKREPNLQNRATERLKKVWIMGKEYLLEERIVRSVELRSFFSEKRLTGSLFYFVACGSSHMRSLPLCFCFLFVGRTQTFVTTVWMLQRVIY